MADVLALQANEVLFVDSEHEDEVLTFREVFLGSRALELLLAGFIAERRGARAAGLAAGLHPGRRCRTAPGGFCKQHTASCPRSCNDEALTVASTIVCASTAIPIAATASRRRRQHANAAEQGPACFCHLTECGGTFLQALAELFCRVAGHRASAHHQVLVGHQDLGALVAGALGALKLQVPY